MRHSWRGTFHLGGKGAEGADATHYHEEMTRVMNAILARASVRIACDDTDPDVVLGFAVYTGPELHFVYVKQDFRKVGIARALLQDLAIKRCTFATRQGDARLKPTARGWKYTPRWTL